MLSSRASLLLLLISSLVVSAGRSAYGPPPHDVDVIVEHKTSYGGGHLPDHHHGNGDYGHRHGGGHLPDHHHGDANYGHHHGGAYDGDHGELAHHDDSIQVDVIPVGGHPLPVPGGRPVILPVALPRPIVPGRPVVAGGRPPIGAPFGEEVIDVVHEDVVPVGGPRPVLPPLGGRPVVTPVGALAAHEVGGPGAPGPLLGAGGLFARPHLPGQPLSQNSFYAQEVFAMHNRGKGTCLSVKPDKKEPKLVTARCNLNQAFAINSPMSFHWKPAPDNNTAFLAIVYDGVQMCARHRWKGTYFYPCNSESTKYSLDAMDDQGRFRIRDSGRGSRCMDAEFKSALRMKLCGRIFNDQKWEKMHIAFMH